MIADGACIKHRWGLAWCWSLEQASAVSPRTSIALPTFVMERAARLMHAVDRQAYLDTHRHVQSTLSRSMAAASGLSPLQFAARWQVDALGKPTVQGALPFSLSHRRTHATLFVSDDAQVAVGIDLERVDGRDLRLDREDDLDELAHEHFTPAERDAVASASHASERVARFLRVWTRKEAILKALGKGLTIETRSFHVGADEAPCAVAIPAPAAMRVEVETLAQRSAAPPWSDVIVSVARVVPTA